MHYPSSHHYHEHYRSYDLIIGMDHDSYVGELFRQGTHLAYCLASDKDSAAQYLRMLAERDLQANSRHHSTFSPSPDEYRASLQQLKGVLPEPWLAMLLYHAAQVDGRASLTDLQAISKQASQTSVSLIYAAISRHMCDFMHFIPMQSDDGRDPYLNILLCPQQTPKNAADSIMLTLRPEVYLALNS